MKCISCKEEIIENSPYCPYCGEAQPIKKQDADVKNNDIPLEQKIVSEPITPEVSSQETYAEPAYLPSSEEVADNDSDIDNNEETQESLEDFSESEEEMSPSETEEAAEEIIESKQKKRFVFSKSKKEPEEPSLVNDDGYYTELYPVKSEKFPVSRGEIIAKFILLGLLLVSLALFLIYVIQ